MNTCFVSATNTAVLKGESYQHCQITCLHFQISPKNLQRVFLQLHGIDFKIMRETTTEILNSWNKIELILLPIIVAKYWFLTLDLAGRFLITIVIFARVWHSLAHKLDNFKLYHSLHYIRYMRHCILLLFIKIKYIFRTKANFQFRDVWVCSKYYLEYRKYEDKLCKIGGKNRNKTRSRLWEQIYLVDVNYVIDAQNKNITTSRTVTKLKLSLNWTFGQAAI